MKKMPSKKSSKKTGPKRPYYPPGKLRPRVPKVPDMPRPAPQPPKKKKAKKRK